VAWWRAAAALALALSTTATAQVAGLQIQVIEGEGGVHAPGSHSKRPLVVMIRDETGQPVSGAAVSFHLPEEGPSGLFANGLRTDVATSDGRGRASPRALRWNRIPGRLQIRIIASKEQVRAGVLSVQRIAAAASRGEKKTNPPHGFRLGWKWALLAAAAALAAAGVLATR
jgi:hypothetical protein